MAKTLVTGSTGQLGNAVLQELVKKIPASDVIALARNMSKAQDLKALGIEVRQGDYDDYDSLVRAFFGVDKIYLVSAVAFVDRFAQHKNVIDAARRAGVRHVIYTSIQRTNDQLAPIEGVTASDVATEQLLKSSGLTYTIVRHPLYAAELPKFLGANAAVDGFSVPAGNGRIALTSREDLAEAGALLLSQECHENRAYLLNAGQTYSFQDVAETLSQLTGKTISYQPISAETYVAAREDEGWPTPVAQFINGWFAAIEKGAFDQSSQTLTQLLGRKPKDLPAILRDAFSL